MDTVSSEALAKAAGVKPTQLRKDLTYFGQFGTRGLGYNVEALSKPSQMCWGTIIFSLSFLWGLAISVPRCCATEAFARRVLKWWQPLIWHHVRSPTSGFPFYPRRR